MKLTRTLTAALAAVLFAAAGMVGAASDASARALSCQNNWDDSNASDHCGTPSILESAVVDARTGATTGNQCDITVSCSFDVTYGPNGGSTYTVTPSLSLATFTAGQMALLEICLIESVDSNGVHTYASRVATACSRTNEYSAEDAGNGQFHN